MKEIPLSTHLVARRFWRPLARLHRWLMLPLLHVPLVWAVVLHAHTWLARRAARQRPVQLYRPSSFAYDLAAIGLALLAPFVRWHQRCQEIVNRETDARLRDDPARY